MCVCVVLYDDCGHLLVICIMMCDVVWVIVCVCVVCLWHPGGRAFVVCCLFLWCVCAFGGVPLFVMLVDGYGLL